MSLSHTHLLFLSLTHKHTQTTFFVNVLCQQIKVPKFQKKNANIPTSFIVNTFCKRGENVSTYKHTSKIPTFIQYMHVLIYEIYAHTYACVCE